MTSQIGCHELSNYERKSFPLKAAHDYETVHLVCVLSLFRLEVPKGQGLETEILLIPPVSVMGDLEDCVGDESICLRGQIYH